MAKAFAEIAFTPAVRDAQTLYGSRRANQRLENSPERADKLTEDETLFIAARDSFFQATVSETGWPYVQFRGGPRGFLKVLDAKTIAFADFRGNVQYVSVGNINADGRIALILVDYPNRQRLKIWGNAVVVHEETDPGLFQKLQLPSYKARVERAIVITVAAYDWNCPQHITPRFTEDEIRSAMLPLITEVEELRERVKQLSEKAE